MPDQRRLDNLRILRTNLGLAKLTIVAVGKVYPDQ